MQREPDWDALNELNFLLYSRVADPLNAALSAIALADMKEAPSGQSPDWWQQRANTKIATVLNLFTAWSWLIQYKTGMEFPERAIRSFALQSLLDWLTIHLQLIPPLVADEDIYIHANQETLQEAILLLHSVATTQGSGTKIIFDMLPNKVEFRVCYSRLRSSKDRLETLDDMLRFLDEHNHWRIQSIAFELKTARDFLALNKCELKLNDNGRTVEFLFSAKYTQAKQAKKDKHQLPSPDDHQSQVVTRILTASQGGDEVTNQTISVDTPIFESAVREKKQLWHLPQDRLPEFRFSSREARAASTIVPDVPLRRGTWHAPKRTFQSPSIPTEPDTPKQSKEDTPIVVSVDLPQVGMPEFFMSKYGHRLKEEKKPTNGKQDSISTTQDNTQTDAQDVAVSGESGSSKTPVNTNQEQES